MARPWPPPRKEGPLPNPSNSDLVGEDEQTDKWLEALERAYAYVPLSQYDEVTKLAQYAVGEMLEKITELAQQLEQVERREQAPPFDWFVAVAEAFSAHYPPDVFDGSSGDPGPLFVVAIREALAALTPDEGADLPEDEG